MSEHLIPTGGGHQLGGRVLEPTAETDRGVALVCFHGVFMDGRFFVNAKGQGPGAWLRDQGYRVLVADLRGRGASRWPEGPRRWDWSFDDIVREDIPAVLRFAATLHPGPRFAVAHSFGGYALLAALGSDPTLQQGLLGVVTLASAPNDYSEGGLNKRLNITAGKVISSLVGRMPGRSLKLGPADEPPALMKQFADWAPGGDFRSLDGATDYWAALGRVTLPALVGVGSADRFHASPARVRRLSERLGGDDVTFLEAGRATGFTRDFEHTDLARGPDAEREVLPKVVEWLRSHTP